MLHLHHTDLQVFLSYNNVETDANIDFLLNNLAMISIGLVTARACCCSLLAVRRLAVAAASTARDAHVPRRRHAPLHEHAADGGLRQASDGTTLRQPLHHSTGETACVRACKRAYVRACVLVRVGGASLSAADGCALVIRSC